MNEIRYQLDLLKAVNQRLNKKERMYRLICESSEYIYIYYSYKQNELSTIGKWDEFFDFTIEDIRDIQLLFDVVEEQYILPLRDVLFLEKSGRTNASVQCYHKKKKTWLQFSCRVVYRDGEPIDKIIVIQNVTKEKTQTDELIYMAYYDSTTGLYNRNYFVMLLGGLIKIAEKNREVVSVMMIDIDDFRSVKDGLGIVAGDELLQQFADCLKEFNGENVLVSHIDSDVFCIAIHNPVGARSVERIYQSIQERIKMPFHMHGGQALSITVSVGVAEYPEAAGSALDLINSAEIVMYKAKSKGKNALQYFNASILHEFLNNVEIENKLKEAVFESNFMLYFQPQYYTSNGKLRGMETLIRWQDSSGCLISPSTFIPIAEKNGAIISIGRWVVEQSIKTYAAWRDKYGVKFALSINISPLQYNRNDFVEELINVIEKYDVNPAEIELEITESVLIDDFNSVIEKLRILRDYGIKISLDDFGTGFSSLGYLKRLPIHTLKIDKSFIDTVLTDNTTRIITESIINMVKALGFESIAEGVENEEQYHYLQAIGCDVIQGYLLGKPMSVSQIDELLEDIF